VVAVSSSNVLGDYYLYDKEANSVRYLIGMSSKLNEIQLSQAQYFAYTNTDGVKIPGWFQPAKTGEKSPLVVVIHGGPHGPYNSFGFSSSWHVLNQLGYSVYAPNFRGSGGFGVSFEKSGYGKWGTGMIDDMQQGAQALVDAGLVDDSQICAMGGSYGGYGTAQSLVRHADFYDCGIIIAGFFDIEALVNKTDVTDSYTGRQYMKAATGGTLEEQRNISPLRNLDKIKAPILLLHGKKDERTPFKGAEEMVSAMKKAGLDFEYKYYNKEGHGNRKMENRVDEWQRVAKFLERTRKSTLASRSIEGGNSSAE
jgi:acylaminoacyl-peptidase